MRKKLLMACAMLLALFLAFEQSGAASAPDKIKFPYSPMSWNSLPWWVAKDAGHFERNGLEVESILRRRVIGHCPGDARRRGEFWRLGGTGRRQ